MSYPRAVPDDGDRPAPAAPPAQVEADVLDHIERTYADLARLPRTEDLTARLDYLVDLLVMRGHLQPGHRRLIDRARAQRRSPFLAVVDDKRAVPPGDIDCASLLHLCQARCCAMSVALSAEDLGEARLAWEIDEPYRLARHPTTGYCRYLGAAGGCTAYADRPATCRSYSCKDDLRVWLDWERKIPAPMETGPFAGVLPFDAWRDREPGPG